MTYYLDVCLISLSSFNYVVFIWKSAPFLNSISGSDLFFLCTGRGYLISSLQNLSALIDGHNVNVASWIIQDISSTKWKCLVTMF
jgi:DNA phosphorothioation-dependent restriction protein DptG